MIHAITYLFSACSQCATTCSIVIIPITNCYCVECLLKTKTNEHTANVIIERQQYTHYTSALIDNPANNAKKSTQVPSNGSCSLIFFNSS